MNDIQREIEIMQMIEHPNVIKLYEVRTLTLTLTLTLSLSLSPSLSLSLTLSLTLTITHQIYDEPKKMNLVMELVTGGTPNPNPNPSPNPKP